MMVQKRVAEMAWRMVAQRVDQLVDMKADLMVDQTEWLMDMRRVA